MDTKRLILGMTLMMLLIFGYQRWMSYEITRHPDWVKKDDSPAPTSPAQPPLLGGAPPSTGTAPLAIAPATGPTSGPTTAGAATGTALTTAPAAPQALGVVAGASHKAILGSIKLDPFRDDPAKRGPYPIGLVINPRGASIDLVVLNLFKLNVDTNDPYYFEAPYLSGGPMSAALGTRWITVRGVSTDLWNVDWALRSDPASVSDAVYAVDITDSAGKKLLTVEKHFEVKNARSEAIKSTGQGYEFDVTYRLVNLAGEPLKVKLAFNGPNTPSIENNRDLAEVFVGSDDHTTVWTGDPHPVLGVKDRNPIDLKDPKGRAFLWVAQRSNYFDAIVRTADPAMPVPGPWSTIYAQAQASDPHNTTLKDVAVGFETDELTIPSAGTQSIPLHVYFGPTARNVLESSYYSSYPLGYDQTLVVSSGMCAFCTFTWLVNALVWLLGIFHIVLFKSWAFAIIALVVLVRLVLHPITKRSQVSMTRMSKMGPEMEKLKKKHGDDKEALNKAMMGFYREQGVTPILGCLPMFLQMPIWIALWNALQSTFEIRHAHFLWIKDLSQPDRAFYFPSHPLSLPIGHISVDAINILPILMAVVFFIQQKLQPKPDIKTLSPEQAQQQKMMQWMSLLFPVFLYGSPSGLNLYILTSTTIGIIEAKRIRDHIKEREEAEKAGKVLVDPKKKGGGPGGFIGRKFTQLQERVEEIRRRGEQQGKNKA